MVPERVAPVPTELTVPFWAAAARRELHIQRCADCRTYVHFPRPECPACGSDRLGFESVSGRGTIATFAVVHRSFVAGPPPPFTIAWIDLVEQPGLRVFSNIVDAPPARAWIGAPVEVDFAEIAGFGLVPTFRLTSREAKE